jgi:hypothetical protein
VEECNAKGMMAIWITDGARGGGLAHGAAGWGLCEGDMARGDNWWYGVVVARLLSECCILVLLYLKIWRCEWLVRKYEAWYGKIRGKVEERAMVMKKRC